MRRQRVRLGGWIVALGLGLASPFWALAEPGVGLAASVAATGSRPETGYAGARTLEPSLLLVTLGTAGLAVASNRRLRDRA